MIERGFGTKLDKLDIPKLFLKLLENTKNFGRLFHSSVLYFEEFSSVHSHQEFDDLVTSLFNKKLQEEEIQILRLFDHGLWSNFHYLNETKNYLCYQIAKFSEIQDFELLYDEEFDYSNDLEYTNGSLNYFNVNSDFPSDVLIKSYIEYLKKRIEEIEIQLPDYQGKKCSFSLNGDYDVTFLDLGEQRYKNIPELSDYKKLTYLWMDDNKIKIIPKNLNQLTKLECLSLQRNEITEIPELYENESMKLLNLSSNNISEIPRSLEKCENLISLVLENCKISKFVSTFQMLKTLNLCHNHLEEIPLCVFSLKNLTSLSLSHNKISSIPSKIKQLKLLRELNLSNNLVTVIPEEMMELSLDELNLDNNQIKKIVNAKNLQVLKLSGNRITYIPKLSHKLKIITLNDNMIEDISQSISSACSLEEIHLKNNNVNSFPASFYELKHIKLLDLRENPKLKNYQQVFHSIEDFNSIKCLQDDSSIFKPLQRMSLCIGVDNYETMNPLSCCVKDAQSVDQILNHKGFDNCKLLQNPDYFEFYRSIQRFVKEIEEDSLIFFYYPGHGGENNGTNFLYPTDGGIKTEMSINIHKLLIKPILESKLRVTLIMILDCCRTETFNPKSKLKENFASFNVDDKTDDQQFFFIYASDPGTVSRTGKELSVFTKEFVSQLSENSDILNIFLNTSRTMKNLPSKQDPWMNFRGHQLIYLDKKS